MDKLLEDLNKNFYTVTKKFSGPSAKPRWSVMDLFPGADPRAAGENVLDYFSSVGLDVPPSARPDLERTVDAGLGAFNEERVADLLRNHKRTVSTVEGDPLPHLVQKFSEAFSRPVAAIFNAINTSVCWPSKWKREIITIIPKNPKPTDLSECRNISCTAAKSWRTFSW